MSELIPEARACLLQLARASIAQSFDAVPDLPPLLERASTLPGLAAPRGAFISLKNPPPAPGDRDALRGCIGSVSASRALYEAVVDLARKAAFEDPRFPPLPADELPLVRIEISVLTPLVPLERLDDLTIGRDGVQLEQSDVRAVFLPQVARELGWGPDELLRQLARKAGLKDDGWRDATLSIFQAEVFGED